MKEARKSITLLALALFMTGASLSAQAQTQPKTHDVPRTLSLTVGETNLQFAPPEKMCFLDRTAAAQNSVYLMLSGAVEKNRDEMVLAVFMPCDNVSAMDTPDGQTDLGFIAWNAQTGDSTRLNRQDYLDMREASFPQYARSRDLGSRPDKTVHRTPYDVALGFIDEEEGRKSIVVIATTTLRHVPVEITVRYANNAKVGTFQQAYAGMDKIIEQQIKLNE